MKILIVEDEEMIARLIRIGLEKAGYSCECVYDGKAAADLLEEKRYDLILLDIMLPEIDGYELLEYVREFEIPVIFITAKSSLEDKVKGLRAGADDYITKPFGVMELISRVKALMRRSRGMEEERMIRLGPIFMDDEKRAVFVDDQQCELTYKEYELLKLLLLNAGIVASRDMILDRVWGTDFEGESRTLDMHIKTLRQKLGSAGPMIRTVRNVGYMLTGEDN